MPGPAAAAAARRLALAAAYSEPQAAGPPGSRDSGGAGSVAAVAAAAAGSVSEGRAVTPAARVQCNGHGRPASDSLNISERAKKKNKSPCSSRCGLEAALQRGHRHRLLVHRSLRYCCLFFGRSGFYPGGRALGCGPGGTRPSGHARRYSSCHSLLSNVMFGSAARRRRPGWPRRPPRRRAGNRDSEVKVNELSCSTAAAGLQRLGCPGVRPVTDPSLAGSVRRRILTRDLEGRNWPG